MQKTIEVKGTLKVGDSIKTNGNGSRKEQRWHRGVVIEVDRESFAIKTARYNGWNVNFNSEVDIEILPKIENVNFLLQYELDEDPIEEFETIEQVKERIEELVLDKNLKRDSIVVWEVSKKTKIEVKTNVEIIGL